MMNQLRFSLFGRFSAQRGNQALDELNGYKFLELFCYLLLYRNHPHPRESIVTQFWSETPAAQSKGYLRKALWQLRTTLDAQDELINNDILLIESDWVQVNLGANFWLDVAVFEEAYNCAEGLPGRKLDQYKMKSLQNAVKLYRGDLLSGWYWDWCLYERERFQHMYMIMLDKLMDYCETHGEYEEGFAYGMCILRYDQARERTHRRLMRLYYLAGDRTEALRQYERCKEILMQELGVKPAKRTITLYEKIRMDQLAPLSSLPIDSQSPDTVHSLLGEMLTSLKQFQTELSVTQQGIQQKIDVVDMLLNSQQ